MSDRYLVWDGKTYDLTPRPAPTPIPPAPDPEPAPGPSPVPTPSAGRRRSLWHHGWAGPSIDTWPVDVLHSLTTVTVAMAQSAQAGTGKVATPPGATPRQIATLAGLGIDVLVGIGGSGDGGIALTNASQVADMVAAVKALADSHGYKGAVLDLEGGPGSGWTAGAAADFGHRLVAAGMKVGICSSTWGGRLEGWGQVAKALGPDLSFWERMFYDFPEAGSNRLNGIVTGDLAAMRRYVSREDQLVCTFMGTPPEGNYPNSSPVGVISGAYAAARTAFPQAGWSLWETRIEGARGWPNLRALAPL